MECHERGGSDEFGRGRMRAFEHLEEVSIVLGKGGRFETARYLWQESSLRPPRPPRETRAKQSRSLLRTLGER